ncbi:MAG TPA: hypothetical protein VFX76_18540, partial [Roseiflexaceae bacterium]|nr:hypothetical protein [Roseiflexaceae bacterium]
MRPVKRLARAGGLILGLALCNLFPWVQSSHLTPLNVPLLTSGQQNDIQVSFDGAIELRANAPPAPQVYGSFQRFGSFLSPIYQYSQSSRQFTISYDSFAPKGADVRVDVRNSVDGARWNSWEVDVANHSNATFATAGRFAQYRVTLLGQAGTHPAIRNVELVARREPGIPTALADEPPPVAPTYRIHATRMGMVGGRTANGHRITKRDHFVSL